MNGLKVFKPIEMQGINDNTTKIVEMPLVSNSSEHSRDLLMLKSANEWMNLAKSQPVPNMLFGPLWHEGELCILTADTNIGKSILGVQIADCITRGIGNYYLPFQAESQAVIYGDFELSFKQFENRYSANYKNHYLFSDLLHRFEINSDFSQITDFNELLMANLEFQIQQTNSRILIIDNITFLRTQSMDTAKEALPLMQRLKALKTKYSLSVLVLAHTPKRSMYNPLTRNDIAGSKHLANFADSIFAIGESAIDKSCRYIKQLKARATEIVFDAENVLECRIVKDTNFLKFEFTGTGYEKDHLQTEPEKEELEQRVLDLQREKPHASLREIAAELGTNQVRVKRILNRHNIKTGK